MAKELPYFQFEPAEYLTKDVSFCSLSAQGLFINICSYYWQRQCDLTKEQFLRRFNYESEFNELIKEGVIDLIDNKISIKFLDIQFDNATKKSNVNSKNGSKGGRPKKPNKNPNESELKPNKNPNESELKGIREDNIIKDEIIQDEIKEDTFTKSNQKGVSFNLPLNFENDFFMDTWKEWKEYKDKEHKFKFKSTISEAKALNQLVNDSQNNVNIAVEMINNAIVKGWKGIYKLDNKNEQNGAKQPITKKSRDEQYNEYINSLLHGDK